MTGRASFLELVGLGTRNALASANARSESIVGIPYKGPRTTPPRDLSESPVTRPESQRPEAK
jgi:hypothetical protein